VKTIEVYPLAYTLYWRARLAENYEIREDGMTDESAVSLLLVKLRHMGMSDRRADYNIVISYSPRE